MKIQLLLVCLMAPLMAVAQSVIQPVESKPVEVGGLEFSVVTQAEWKPFRDNGSKWDANSLRQDEIIVQLRIVNKGTKPVIFPTFDSFSAKLKMPDGKTEWLAGNRDGTAITPKFLLKPGQGYSYPLVARLVYGHDGDKVELLFRDLTGGGSSTVMPPGEYSLQFHLQPTHYNSDKGKDVEELWAATGDTEAVAFKVLTAAKK